ncbi:MAG: HlyD family efflux transporter periplasmic adaptor subunit [Nonomuraea sp.]|nr:HlyD family efflux transporter periplasmic adaptor subunit [Nonomuraea sp.]
MVIRRLPRLSLRGSRTAAAVSALALVCASASAAGVARGYGVSAIGALAPSREGNLGFPKGGKLLSVDVVVGDWVQQGQRLGAVDSFALRRAMRQQRAQWVAARASWRKARHSPTIATADRTLGQAEQLLDATQAQTGQQLDFDDVTIRNALHVLVADAKQLGRARDRLATAKATCAKAKASGSSSALMACSGVLSYQSALDQARMAIVQGRASFRTAVATCFLNQAAGRVAVENVGQSVVAAANQLDTATAERPFILRQLRATARGARAAWRASKRDVYDTVLRAPFSGTVSVVNGTVGETVAPASGTTETAPGSRAAVPRDEQAAPFVVLSDTDHLQLVITVPEVDAVSLSRGQRAEVSFTAIPDLMVPGTVQAVAPAGTDQADVINFDVTVRLSATDARLKPGLTARATIS